MMACTYEVDRFEHIRVHGGLAC